jgi:molecular chaperone GrpE
MARTNGKSEVQSPTLDTEHELPPSQEGADDGERPVSAENKSEVDTLKAERDQLLDRLARLQAEFENARRRMSQEQQSFREYASADTIKALLPVLDSFERALKSSSESEKAEFRNGVELIYKQLQDALTKAGLQPIVAKGEQFDPHVHEAIEMVETEDAPDHEVLEELQRGYRLKQRLLRPAMVRVARNPKHR